MPSAPRSTSTVLPLVTVNVRPSRPSRTAMPSFPSGDFTEYWARAFGAIAAKSATTSSTSEPQRGAGIMAAQSVGAGFLGGIIPLERRARDDPVASTGNNQRVRRCAAFDGSGINRGSRRGRKVERGEDTREARVQAELVETRID